MKIVKEVALPNELIEKLAALEHAFWSQVARTALDDMTPERIARWHELVDTPYDELSEDMKQKDRDQVLAYLEVLSRHLHRQRGDR